MPNKITGKVVVIGDTHGDYLATRAILKHLTKSNLLKNRTVVFLGDYVDMGPDTSDLLDLLITFQKSYPTVFCCGNHDLNLAKALGIVDSPHREFYWDRIPTRNATVLDSYGVKDGHQLLEVMPKSHRDFLANLAWLVEHPNYIFVHAGLDPGESLEDQLAELRRKDATIFKPKWLYEDYLAYQTHDHQTDKTVVVGHVNLRQVMAGGNKIIIDTGCGYGGSLTALLLPEMQLIQTDSPLRWKLP